jgi:hypothetical protein
MNYHDHENSLARKRKSFCHGQLILMSFELSIRCKIGLHGLDPRTGFAQRGRGPFDFRLIGGDQQIERLQHSIGPASPIPVEVPVTTASCPLAFMSERLLGPILESQ